MSKGSAGALQAHLEISGRFDKLADKDFAAAASVLIRKLMISAGQTTEDMAALKAAAGDEIFETTLKSLTPHQAKQLARRLDTLAQPRARVRLLLADVSHEAYELGEVEGARAVAVVSLHEPQHDLHAAHEVNGDKSAVQLQ